MCPLVGRGVRSAHAVTRYGHSVSGECARRKPPDPEGKSRMIRDGTETGSHHLYVHVPFCRLVCAYCDFVTVGGRADDVPRYVDALLGELGLCPAPGTLRT